MKQQNRKGVVASLVAGVLLIGVVGSTEAGIVILKNGDVIVGKIKGKSAVTNDEITVRWRTDDSSSGPAVVRYGTSPNELDRAAVASEVHEHFPGMRLPPERSIRPPRDGSFRRRKGRRGQTARAFETGKFPPRNRRPNSDRNSDRCRGQDRRSLHAAKAPPVIFLAPGRKI